MLRLSNGAKSSFRMTEFDPLRHWKWVGRFLGSEIIYDHIFIEEGPSQTMIRFVVDANGWSLPFIGGIFGRIYRRNLEQAVPLLVQEINAKAMRNARGDSET